MHQTRDQLGSPSTAQQDTQQQPAISHRRRGKWGHLDWEQHKGKLKRLYMDENRGLPETMEIMKKEDSFDAPVKVFKEKFKEWSWQKNLPTSVAHFISQKARQRKRERNVDTVFIYGGKEWNQSRADSTLHRSKKIMPDDQITDIETPAGVSYETPQALVVSPAYPGPGTNFDEDSEDWDSDSTSAPISIANTDSGSLALTWKGYTRSGLVAMLDVARGHNRNGNLQTAENLFSEVYEGLCNILGTTHEDTSKVAFSLADVYARRGRMEEADALIEKMTREHVEHFGYEHRRTQAHVLRAIEQLNGWNRPEDALGLLYRSKEIMDTRQTSRRKFNTRTRPNQGKGKGKAISGRNMSFDIQEVIGNDCNPRGVDCALALAHNHVAVKDEAAQTILLALIKQCELYPENLTLQHLRAYGELLKLYQDLDEVDEHRDMFIGAPAVFHGVFSRYDWDEEKYQCIEIMEAAMQMAANMVKCGFDDGAKSVFDTVSDRADELFGIDEERTIWVLITIGLVYQTHKTWIEAADWFDRAYSGALSSTAWDGRDGIVKSLEHARERRHFSWISDEGRPFKTIFGVNGIVIRPGRLNIE